MKSDQLQSQGDRAVMGGRLVVGGRALGRLFAGICTLYTILRVAINTVHDGRSVVSTARQMRFEAVGCPSGCGCMSNAPVMLNCSEAAMGFRWEVTTLTGEPVDSLAVAAAGSLLVVYVVLVVPVVGNLAVVAADSLAAADIPVADSLVAGMLVEVSILVVADILVAGAADSLLDVVVGNSAVPDSLAF